MKDRRLTPQQIDKLLANNPHKIELNPVVREPIKQFLCLKGTNKNYDTLNSTEQLKNICGFIRDVIARYENNIKTLEQAEAEENDLRHCIELAEKLTEKEKKTLYNKLTDVLQTRRACKSENEILQPLYDYFNDKTLLNKFSQIQGVTTNIKEIVTNRTYSCRTRVLDDFRSDSSL